jgi:4-amino-4-deoxy-L-arabinose transferase-like glycosyltransferase
MLSDRSLVRRLLTICRRHLAIIAILMLAAGVRCAFLVSQPPDQAGLYGEIARNILDHGRWFVENTHALEYTERLRREHHRDLDPAEIKFTAVDAHPHYRPVISEVIGPGFVLTAAWELTGSRRYVYGDILQILIDLGTLLLVYRIAMLLFSRRRAALAAAGLYAVFLPIAGRATIFNQDIWAVDFTVAVIYLYLEAIRSPNRWRWLLVCGLTVGVGAYFRANVLLLPAALTLASLRWVGVSRSLRNGVAIMAVAVLPLAPWAIKNYIEFHRFIPIRIGAGVNLWEGLGEIPNNYGPVLSDLGTYEQVQRVRPDLVYLSPAYDDYLRQHALHVIEQHPLFYAKIIARRILFSTLVVYESAWMNNGGESPVHYRARTGKGLFSYAVNRPFELLESILEPVTFVLAMLALAFTWRGRRRQHLLLIAAILSAVAPYWLLHVEARYILPIMPIYLMWIALGADLLGERVMVQRRTRQSLRRRPAAGTA